MFKILDKEKLDKVILNLQKKLLFYLCLITIDLSVKFAKFIERLFKLIK